uniref:Uncharacterized protein n=1 Tax=Chondria sp. (in: red algae) TaxID=1982705 RepID=A0A1Z1MR28_9FLOR|nr:hypothetical protein [Chondria sp. (in: red algae)]
MIFVDTIINLHIIKFTLSIQYYISLYLCFVLCFI